MINSHVMSRPVQRLVLPKLTNRLGAAQDPNARNCHGYRKFVKRSVLENLNNGYLVNDTIVIRYTIELVVSTGGALTRQPGSNAPKLPLIQVLRSSLPTFWQDDLVNVSKFICECMDAGC